MIMPILTPSCAHAVAASTWIAPKQKKPRTVLCITSSPGFCPRACLGDASSWPELLARQPRAGAQRREFRPGNLWVNASAETAIGPGDHVFTSDDACETNEPVGDKLGVLEDIGCVTDDARNQDLALRQLRILPDLPLVLVADIAGLDHIGLRLHLEQEIDDILQRDVALMRSVPAAPANMEANAILGNS